jgi:hypothetical protein
LQTASLDKELKAQKGFFTSEMLMMDSVALVRRKVADSNVAFKDETLNSVVTLAAIEVRTCHFEVLELSLFEADTSPGTVWQRQHEHKQDAHRRGHEDDPGARRDTADKTIESLNCKNGGMVRS